MQYRHRVSSLACAVLLALLFVQAAWATETFTTLSGQQAAELLAAPPADLVVLDMRTPDEFKGGHVAGVQNIDFFGPNLEAKLLPLDRTKNYLVYCKSGVRSEKTLAIMKTMGFKRISHVAGGIGALQSAGVPLVQ